MPTPKVARLVSIQEVRLLSELAKPPLDEISPTDLSKRTGIPRPTAYVLLRRLAERKMVGTKPAGGGLVLYCITGRGITARKAFAKATGLTA